MSKHRKRFSTSQKLEILNYYKQHGIVRTCRRYDVSNTSLYRWEEILDREGPEGLENRQKGDGPDPELMRLRRENKALKSLVAEKELEIRIQKEILKKANK